MTVNFWVLPLLADTDPDGEIVPFDPAEAVIVYVVAAPPLGLKAAAIVAAYTPLVLLVVNVPAILPGLD